MTPTARGTRTTTLSASAWPTSMPPWRRPATTCDPWVIAPMAGRCRSVMDHPRPCTQVELREMWTYSDGARTVKAYWRPGDAAVAGSWVLVDQETGNVQGVVAAGEFSRR